MTNYSISNALELYTKMANNFSTFSIFAIVCLIFITIILINIDNKNTNFLYYALNLILIGIIIWTHGLNIINNLDSFLNINLYKNIYFYLANMVLSLIIITKVLSSNRNPKELKYIICFFYYLLLTNLLFMLYISNYLKNIMLFVIGNTYPMVYFGNILAFIMYIMLIAYLLFFSKKVKKHRFGAHL